MLAWLRKLLWNGWAIVGVVTTVIGFSGIPDDLQQWYVLVNDLMENATALALAELT